MARRKARGKLSVALLRFAEPLTERLPENAGPAELESVLRLASLVWNSVVIEELGYGRAGVEPALRALPANAPGGLEALHAALGELERAKRAESPMDLRLIGHIELLDGANGELRLRASEVAPPSPPRENQGRPPARRPAARPAPAATGGEGPWHELFREAREFRALAPWRWMLDRDLFGLRELERDETLWGCVLGAGGELRGLLLYRGERGFDFHRRLHGGELEQGEARFGQPVFLLAFVDRSDLFPEQLARVRESGLTFRGSGEWPQVESHDENRLPRPVSEDEARLVTRALRQAREVALAFQRDEALLEPDPAGRLLVRVGPAAGPASAWRDERHAPPPPLPPDPVPDFDALQVERLRRSLEPSDLELECDLPPMKTVIAEPNQDPYFPAFFLLADSRSGIILHHALCHPAERRRLAQVELLAGLSRLGRAPRVLRVRSASVERTLAPLARALGLVLERVPELPALDELLDEMSLRFG